MPWHDKSMTICCILKKNYHLTPVDTCLSIIFLPKIRDVHFDININCSSISRHSFSSYKPNRLVYTNTKLTPPRKGFFVRLKSNQIRIVNSRETKVKGKLTIPSRYCMNIKLHLTYLISTSPTALKFVNSIHFPFDKLPIIDWPTWDLFGSQSVMCPFSDMVLIGLRARSAQRPQWSYEPTTRRRHIS